MHFVVSVLKQGNGRSPGADEFRQFLLREVSFFAGPQGMDTKDDTEYSYVFSRILGVKSELFAMECQGGPNFSLHTSEPSDTRFASNGFRLGQVEGESGGAGILGDLVRTVRSGHSAFE